MKQTLSIPKSALGEELTSVIRQQLRAEKLLAELEVRYTGVPGVRPGTWRHDPSGFMAQKR